ncbi:MAG: tryptophan synthase subunit alpha [Candidatus Marinimicrobia bacterium]|nr:tryptophan synthase subunit alpha [Candidatus Neomarinimicrobiota bacterium]
MRSIGRLFRTGGKKLVPFLTAGYPNLDDTLPLVLAAEDAGAHMIELGMPFSDPLADGPVIQAASQQALANGVTVEWVLETVSAIRSRTTLPLVLMGYVNPLRRYGSEAFIEAASSAGADGLIVPDLPPEEGRDFFRQARDHGLSTVYLVAPNTPSRRIEQLGAEAEDLLYAVSILGVTGSRISAREKLPTYLKGIRQATRVPFVVGFGITTAADVRSIAPHADGVVVGSALLRILQQAGNPARECREYLGTLAEAMD